MTKEEQKKLQEKQLFIMDEIDRICKKHDIKYSLAAGTLLGAIRHNGFIPWDDDFDITMTRDNYDKFLDIREKELDKDVFYLQIPTKEHEYPHFFAKIRLNNTLQLENMNIGKNFHQGIFVDIFPEDYCCNNKLAFYFKLIHITIVKTLILKNLNFPVKGRSKLQKFVIALLTPISKIINVDKLKIKTEKFLRKQKKRTKYSISYTGNLLFNAYIDTSIFEKYTTHKFENKEYSILENYDEYLKWIYGDYMTPPPKETREIGHDIKKIDFNTKNKKGF